MALIDTPITVVGGLPAARVDGCRPQLGTVIRRVALSLAIACAIPAALFYIWFRLADVWTAILFALAWSYGAIAWRALSRRRTSGLLILTATVMTGRTVIALATDSTHIYFLQPIITDGLIAATFLVSLATARPMVARLAGDFYPMDRELSLRPRLRRLFWCLTLMWGALCLGKATMTLWLLQTQSLETFVLVKSIAAPTINALAVAATIGAAVLVARKEGLLLSPAAEQREPAVASPTAHDEWQERLTHRFQEGALTGSVPLSLDSSSPRRTVSATSYSADRDEVRF